MTKVFELLREYRNIDTVSGLTYFTKEITDRLNSSEEVKNMGFTQGVLTDEEVEIMRPILEKMDKEKEERRKRADEIRKRIYRNKTFQQDRKRAREEFYNKGNNVKEEKEEKKEEAQAASQIAEKGEKGNAIGVYTVDAAFVHQHTDRIDFTLNPEDVVIKESSHHVSILAFLGSIERMRIEGENFIINTKQGTSAVSSLFTGSEIFCIRFLNKDDKQINGIFGETSDVKMGSQYFTVKHSFQMDKDLLKETKHIAIGLQSHGE